MAGPACTHLIRICIKHTCIVGLPMFCEEFHYFRVYLIAVVLARLYSHADAAVRLKGTLKRLIGLEAHYGFLFLI